MIDLSKLMQARSNAQVFIDVGDQSLRDLTGMQFGSNGYSIVGSIQEAKVIVTDDPAKADKLLDQTDKRVVLLTGLPGSNGSHGLPATPESKRFCIANAEYEGFGAFRKAMAFVAE